jgi:hypothetical protein
MPQYVKELSLIPYIKPYVAAPVKEMEELQKKTADDYDVAASEYDALEELKDNMKYIKGSKGDEQAFKLIFDEATKEVEDAKKSGDYQNKGRLIRKITRKFKTNYKQLLSRYESYTKNVSDILDMKDLKEEDKKAAIKSLEENYLQKPEFNANNNLFLPSWKDYVPHKNEDRQKIIEAFAEKIRSKKYDTLPKNKLLDDKLHHLVSVSGEQLTDAQIYNLATAYAAQSPEIQMDLEREAKLLPYKQDINNITENKDFQFWLSKKYKVQNEEDEIQLNNLINSGKPQKEFYTEQLLHKDATNIAQALKIDNFNYDIGGVDEYDKLKLKADFDKKVAAEDAVLTEQGNQDVGTDFASNVTNINSQQTVLQNSTTQLIGAMKNITSIVGQKNFKSIMGDLYNGVSQKDIIQKYKLNDSSFKVIASYFNDFDDAKKAHVNATEAIKESQRYIKSVSPALSELKDVKMYLNRHKEASVEKAIDKLYNAYLMRREASDMPLFNEAKTKDEFIKDLIDSNPTVKEKLSKLDMLRGVAAEGTAIGEQMNNVATGVETNPLGYKIAGSEDNIYTRLVKDGLISEDETSPQIKVVTKNYGLAKRGNNSYYGFKLQVGEGKDAKYVTYKINADLNSDIHDRGIRELYKAQSDRSLKEEIEFDYVTKHIHNYKNAYELTVGSKDDGQKSVVLKSNTDKYKVERATDSFDKDGNYIGSYVVEIWDGKNWKSVKTDGKLSLHKSVDSALKTIGHIELN